MRVWLKRLREENGFSQQSVAEKMNITQQNYSLIESGQRQNKLRISTAKKIAQIFGIDLSRIIEEEEGAFGEVAEATSDTCENSET